jgi:hypothetical protein
MSNDDDLGGLEDLAKARDLLFFYRAFHQLSPVGGSVIGTAGLGYDTSTLPPGKLALDRAIEVQTEGHSAAVSVFTPSMLALSD